MEMYVDVEGDICNEVHKRIQTNLYRKKEVLLTNETLKRDARITDCTGQHVSCYHCRVLYG